MGADVYLSSIRKQFKGSIEESQTSHQWSSEITGYFRNSYNEGDVMWAMGLSWWDTVKPMLEHEFWLPVHAARKLLALIEERPLTKEGLTDHYLENLTSGVNEHPDMGPVSRMLATGVPELGNIEMNRQPPDFEAWAQFLRCRREQLIAILRKSIEIDEPLFCDL